MRLRAIPPIPFLIWVVGPAETYATSDHWATTSWAWTDRRNSWPWHAPIRGARFSNRISSRWHYRSAASMASLRMHRSSQCRARSWRGFWLNSPTPWRPGGCSGSELAPKGKSERIRLPIFWTNHLRPVLLRHLRFEIGRRGWARGTVLMTFVSSVHHPKIMLGMLVKVLRGDWIATRRLAR